LLQQSQNLKSDGNLLSSSSSLQQNQKQEGDDNKVIVTLFIAIKPKTKRQCHLLRYNKTKNKKEMATLLLSPSSLQQNQKQEGNGNFAVIAFFVATKPKKKATIAVAIAFFAATKPKKKATIAVAIAFFAAT